MRLTGVTANLKVGNTQILGAYSWAQDETADVLDATGFGSPGNYHEYAPQAMVAGTITIDGHWDSADLGLYAVSGGTPSLSAGQVIEAELFVDETNYYGVTVIVDKFGSKAERLNLVSWNLTGKVTGPPTYPVGYSGSASSGTS